jgi:hypothetical protein
MPNQPFRDSLIVPAFVLGLLCAASGLVTVVKGHIDAPRMNRAGTCETARDRDCFVEVDGRVVSLDSVTTLRSGNAVTIDYDDDRYETTLDLRGDAHPPVGARVRVRLWDGEPAAIVDRRGRIYKDALAWPSLWDRWSLALSGAGALMAVLASVPWLRRRR